MSHPFGNLLAQHLHRKHGLSQSKLATGILQSPSVITDMCQGKRLQGRQARERVIAIIAWLQQQAVLATITEANALLAAAGMVPLNLDDSTEQLRFPQEQSPSPVATPAKLVDHRTALPASHNGFVGRTQEFTPLVQRDVAMSSSQELPDFLRSPSPTPAQQVDFVARENELAHLDRQLNQMLAGRGLVSFVIGEAGSGKTILLREFVQRALTREANLVVATGNCNAYGGLGDPYLPFREIMALLTGDVEARWRAGVLSHDHAGRLWRLLPGMAQALIHHGASLIEIFLSGAALYERAALAVTDDPPWLRQLETLVAQSSTRHQPPAIDQSALFEMYTRVLQTVAQQRPLILVVDDLQWADSGSISLLFHLGRRLAGQRIWVIGAYRPQDLVANHNRATGGEGERHPLGALVHEFQQLFGEKPIDLGQCDGQHFVESIVNLEKHRLPVTFRTQLFQHTRGHALFTTEILRSMQRRGDLVRDPLGDWIIGSQIDWAQLPNRVEGVISARINHLPTPLLEIVKVASVMGEEFIAEVIARVLRQEERTVVRQLGTLLDRQHDLVQSQGNLHLETQRLSHYRFRHILFQHYLYQTLDEGERAYLHEDIGHTLEQFYHDQTEQVAVQLARHFRAAGLTSKALHYLQQAGEQANGRLAFREAVGFFQDALWLLERLPAIAGRQRQQVRLQLALGEAQQKAGAITQSLHSFQQAAAIAYAQQWAEDIAQAALGYEKIRYRVNQPAEPAIHLLQQALTLVGDEDRMIKARLLAHLAQALFCTGAAQEAELLSYQAIEMARHVDDASTLFDTLYVRALYHRKSADIQARLAAGQELLDLARLLRDQERLVYTCHLLTCDAMEAGDLAAVDRALALNVQVSEELQQTFLNYIVYVQHAMRATMMGNFAEAETFVQRARAIGQQMQVEVADGIHGILMFTLQREQGSLAPLTLIIQDYAKRNSDSVWRPGLALIYADLGLLAEARVQFEWLAANDFAALPQDAMWVGSMAYLSEVCALLQDKPRAAQLYQHLLPSADVMVLVGFGIACLGATAHFLALLATTLEDWAVAENHFEQAMQRNAQIKAKPRLAHTQVQYAVMRLRRNQPDDRAAAVALLNQALEPIETLGMKFLATKVEAIRQQYFSPNA